MTVRCVSFSKRVRGIFVVLLVATLTVGCAGYQSYLEGRSALAGGQAEQGVSKLKEAMEKSPSNNNYRRSYFAERETAVNSLLRDADVAMAQGSFFTARDLYERAAKLDPSSPKAAAGVDRTDAAERHWDVLEAATIEAKAGKLDTAVSKVQQVLSENPNHRRANLLQRQFMRQQADITGKELGIYPRLKAAFRMPVSLSFSNASLLQVFESLKQASGLNYMIERDVRPDLRVTLSVTNKPVEDIVRLLLATNQLERRVLDDDTLLIYPNTPAKVAEYREMVVRVFYLSNAEAAKVANSVRSVAKARDVVVDEKLNMLIVRDSADVVRLAEKLIAAQDIPDPEVMLELEVLEVSANRLLEMGIRWPDSISASVAGADRVSGQLTLNEFRNRSADMVTLSSNNPLVSAQFRGQKGEANLLANPRVRIRNNQSAKILIGERVPVITTTSTANVGTAESVSYLDVGLKLDIEPTVSLDGEVAMKIALEVSNILETVTRASGTQAYRLGTRNTSTSLRVRDGETNILAGLIQRDERRSNTGIPGLNEIPLLGKLFGAAQDSDARTEIVLLITPRIVRNLDVPGVGLQEFLSGTDSAVGASPIQLGSSTSPGVPSRAFPASSRVEPAPLAPQVLPQPPVQPPALTPPPLVPAAPVSR